jgi:hypothetical protein
MTEETAPSVHDQMVEAYIAGDNSGAQELFQDASRENGVETGPPSEQDPTRLPPMPPAPTAEASIVQKAASTLSDLGPEGAALVSEWGGGESSNFRENLAYAKSAFADIAQNRPDLIAKVDASGLGNDPAILRLLAQHGRLNANMKGDISMSNYEPPAQRERGYPSFSGSARAEMNQLLNDNPPGSERYKNPRVQQRVQQLSRMIAGDGGPIGTGGRTA